jgi:hypothetical protein
MILWRERLIVAICMLLLLNLIPICIWSYSRKNPPLEELPKTLEVASQMIAIDTSLLDYSLLVNDGGSAAFRYYTNFDKCRFRFHSTLLHRPIIPIPEAYNNPQETEDQLRSIHEKSSGALFFASHLNNGEMEKLTHAIKLSGWKIRYHFTAHEAAYYVLD